MKKKETTLSVLKEIRDLLRDKKEETSSREVSSNEIIIDMPSMTMKDIYKKSGNKTSKGTPLFYNTGWYENEDFFTKEKTRKGKWKVSKTLLEETRNKTWNEQEEILKSKGATRLNAAEVMYILWQHEKTTGERLLDDWNYTWTSSKTSDGRLAYVGIFSDSGGYVYRGRAGISSGSLGSVFSAMII